MWNAVQHFFGFSIVISLLNSTENQGDFDMKFGFHRSFHQSKLVDK